MATTVELIREIKGVLGLTDKSLDEMPKEPSDAPDIPVQPSGVTIEWLNERIQELEAVNAALSASQTPQEDAQVLL